MSWQFFLRNKNENKRRIEEDEKEILGKPKHIWKRQMKKGLKVFQTILLKFWIDIILCSSVQVSLEFQDIIDGGILRNRSAKPCNIKLQIKNGKFLPRFGKFSVVGFMVSWTNQVYLSTRISNGNILLFFHEYIFPTTNINQCVWYVYVHIYLSYSRDTVEQPHDT